MMVSLVKVRKTVHSCHFVELGLMPEMSGHLQPRSGSSTWFWGQTPQKSGSNRGKGDGNWIDLRICVQELAVQRLGRQAPVVTDTAKISFLLCEGEEEECP